MEEIKKDKQMKYKWPCAFHTHCSYCGEILDTRNKCASCDPEAFGICQNCEEPLEDCRCSEIEEE